MKNSNSKIFAGIILLSLLCGCKSTSKIEEASSSENSNTEISIVEKSEKSENAEKAGESKDGVVVAAENSEEKDTAETLSENTDSKKDKKAKKQKKHKKTKEEKAYEKLLKKQKRDKYTGWVYLPEKKFSITNGELKIFMDGRTGCFCIYGVPENLKPVPLISEIDSFSSSYFSVKIAGKEYRLNRENGVKSEARRTPYGAQMVYTIEKKAQVVVDFSFMPSIASSSRVDMFRVTIYVINLGKKITAFSVKGVFDTILGENSNSHFSTLTNNKINSEKQFMAMADDLWIRSANQDTAIQFLLHGKGITPVQYVSLGSKSSIDNNSWIPQLQIDKSFSTVLSYNNSALALNWNTVYLDPMKTSVITFYISTGCDGNEPAGRKFLSDLAAGRTALSAKASEFRPVTNVAATPDSVDEEDIKTIYWENMPTVPEKAPIPYGEKNKEEENTNEYKGYSSEYIYSSKDKIPVKQKTAEEEKPVETEKPAKTEKAEPVKKEVPVIESKPVQKEEEKKAPAVKEEYIAPKEEVSDVDFEYIQRILERINEIQSDSDVENDSEIELLNKELDSIYIKLQEIK